MKRIFSIGAVLAVAAFAIWHPAPRAGGIVAQQPSPPARHARKRAGSRHSPASTPATMVVYVVGAVAHPGLYPLSPGARVNDAVKRAGGLTAAADPAGVNLAQRLGDGAEIDVPRLGAEPARRRRASCVGCAGASTRRKVRKAPPAQPIDLNAADVASIASLPGIGERLAARIVQYRQLNGPFVSVDELADVSGMTDHRIEQVAPFIIVH